MSRTCRRVTCLWSSTSRTLSTPCGVTSYSRPSNVTCLSCFHMRPHRTARTVTCSSMTSRCSHRRGRSRRTRSDRFTSAWPSTSCCHRCSRRLSSAIWTRCRWEVRRAGWQRTSIGWSRARRSLAGLTLNRFKCEVAGLTNATRSILAARGVMLQETTQEDLVLLGSLVLPGRGVDTVLASKREDLETLAGRLPLMPAHDSLFLLRNVPPRRVWSTRRGQRRARAARSSACMTRCSNQPWAQPSMWTCRMGDGRKPSCQYDEGDWGFVVLLCWHRLPTWHRPLALRPWS